MTSRELCFFFFNFNQFLKHFWEKLNFKSCTGISFNYLNLYNVLYCNYSSNKQGNKTVHYVHLESECDFFFKDIHYFNIIVHATHLREVTGLILDELFTHKNCVMTNLTLNCSYLALVIKDAIFTTNKNILIIFFVYLLL